MLNQKRSTLILGLVILLVITNVISYRLALQNIAGEEASRQPAENGDTPEDDYRLFFSIMDILSNEYLEELDRRELLEGAIEGLLKTLDDPQTTFLSSGEMQEFFVFLRGSFGGIGVRIVNSAQGGVTVLEVLPDTPAEQEGLQTGDRICYVDGVDVRENGVERAVELIRGEKGSEVTVSIMRPGSEEKMEFVMVREEIASQTVTGEWLEPGFGYIKISQFDGGTGDDFLEIYGEMESEGLQGLVLDLRDNPGGVLHEALKVANVLVPEGEIVRIVDRDGKVKDIHHSYAYPKPFPMVVLINGGSASGSEIIAGALQDHDAAVLVGDPTFGKATVQHFETFRDGNGFRYTVAKYVTPAGNDLHGQGLTPDYEVELPLIYNYYYYFVPGTIEEGDFGQSVFLLQEILAALDYDIEPTGYFDWVTETILKDFQKDNLLTDHGKFDDITWVYLRLELDKVIREKDYQLKKALELIKEG